MCSPSKSAFVVFALWLMAAVAFGNEPGIGYVTFRPYVIWKTIPIRYDIDKPLPEGLNFDFRSGKIRGAPLSGLPASGYALVAAPDITYPTPNTYFRNLLIPPLQPTNTGGDVPATIYSETKVIAGTGQFGTVNGDAANAQFKLPYGISIDDGGNMYIAESGGGIRMISASGQVSSIGTDALPGPPFNVPKFNNPRGVVKDKNGNLFVANYSNHNILKITPAGIVTIFAGINQSGTADGPGNVANIINPSGIAIDKDDNLYVTDGNNAIRKISPSGYVYTIAGPANFNKPAGITVDKDGNVYVADRGGFAIRKISPNGQVTTIAGSGVFGTSDGNGAAASFQSPVGITVDASGNLYVTEDGLGTVRRISPDGEVKTIAGGGPPGAESGVGTNVRFSAPSGIAIGPDGNLYVAEYGRNSVKQVIATGYTIDKVLPAGLNFDPRTGIITGTPTVLWPPTDYTVTAYNAGGSSKFTLNIEVLDTAVPTISAGNASGIIDVCIGSPSTSTQQFTVTGTNLTDNITVSAPAGFEISANPAGGFTNILFLVTQGSTVSPKVIYVRAAVTGTPANLSGAVTLTSAGAVTEKVNVTATIYAPPTVDHIADLDFSNGDVTPLLNFTGTGNTFYWTNDKPVIGLAASGEDNIPSFTAINPGSSPVVAQIRVTSKMANLAYIPNYSSNTVSVINTITNKIINTIPVGPNPGLVAISPDAKKVYVGNVGGTSLSIINTQNNQVKIVTIFDSPTGLIFSKDGTRAYVAGASGQCTVIDVANDAVLNSLTFFSGSTGIALSDDGQWIYATNDAMGEVRVYDTGSNTEIINIPAPGSHYAVTSRDGTKIYVAGGASNCIWVIDVATNTMLAPINLNSDANILALSPDGSRIYVTNLGAGTVTVINATDDSIITSLPVGQSPEGVSVTPDGRYVYVVNVDSGTISIIDTSNYTVIATIPCGLYPRAVGNFITPGANSCPGIPTDFKITVNPSATTITTGTVGGLITTCIGAPSTSLQQFTVSGNNLSGNITAASPVGFEISFSQTSGFTDVLNIAPTGGAVNNKVIFVRAKASGSPASLLGDVILTTAGAASKNVTVKGVVNDLPKTDAIGNLVYNNGDITTAIKFTGTGNTYNWTNDKPSIGLGASGTGDIPSFTAINTGIPPIVANISVTPSSNGYLYLTGANNMILVDADNNRQTGTINTGGQPIGTSVSPDGSLVAITDANTNTVKFINTTTHEVVSTVNNILLPIGICFSPDGKKVYVANGNTSNMTIIDVLTATAEPPVYVGVYPYGIAVSPDGLTVYIGCTGENAIIAIDTKTRQRTAIPVNFGPTGIAVSPDNSRIYATSAQYNGLLKVVDAATKTVIANIPIGNVSTGICVSPDGKWVYVSNTQSNNVMVIDAEINKVIATIPTGNHPFGLSITPDGKYVYVANDGSSTVNVINTATNSIISNITVTGQLSKSFGNFFVPGTGCAGIPTKFTITVNGPPVITASAVTGTISACMGSPSLATQQFNISGDNLSNDITVTAPANFEVSLSQGSGFANSLIITQNAGTVTNQVVYVRSSAGAPSGNISGTVTVASAGAPNQTVNVSSIINALPTVNPIPLVAFNNGSATTAILFTGTATSYTWTNDNPAIGLPANGTGDIPSFTAINNGQALVTANITVTPANASCTGTPITFKININPTTLTAGAVSGSITACQGSASSSPDLQQFSVSGNGLQNNVTVTAPANFQVSLSQGAGYSGTLTIVPVAGKVNSTIIYVRSSAGAPSGNISGTVTVSSAGAPDQTVNVSGIINALPAVNPVPTLAFINGSATTAIHFTGTATSYTWTNDNPAIGLPANGTGDIPSFTAVNNGQALVTANITVTPANASCTGIPITFKININPTTLTASAATGSITACQGSPSVSPNLQQFSITGNGLQNNVTVTAPANFQVSLSQGAGYSGTLTIVPVAGKVNSTVIYVRSSATAPANNISGTANISSAGAPSQTVNVSGIINALPAVNALPNVAFNNGSVTTAIHFTGTATTYTWTNDNPAIGLPANGSGDIPSFTAVNNGQALVTANITVTPANASCTGIPVTFKINVNPTTLAAGPVSGSINACQGLPSVSPDLQRFSVSGNALTNNITVTAPANFEVSLSQTSGFANSLIITQNAGTVTNQVVYVRSSATAPANSISGTVTISSVGAPSQTVNVSGIINALPTVNLVSPLALNNGSATTAIHFTGTATSYTWTNDNPAIGLPANGTGDIPSFTAINNGQALVTANITVTPANASCTGSPVTFKININPTTLTASAVTGSITACQGSPSASPDLQQFSVSGNALTNNITVTAPANFQVSLSQGAGYSGTLTIVPVVGKVNSTIIYVRSSATAPSGNISGTINISSAGAPNQTVNVSGIINALPTVNQLPTLAFNNGSATTAIHFTGTATNYTWTNDNPAIGLPANGTGDIPSFTAVNNGQASITANITVVPANASCTGTPVTFKININPTTLTASAVTGSITACQGSPSASPDLQQFSVSGNGLQNNITVTAPANFQVSLSQGTGYSGTLTIVPVAGKVNSTIIYVRSSAGAPSGNISGSVTVSSAGAPNQTVNVSGVINALPTINPLPTLALNNGSATTAIHFTGTATSYTWTNDNPAIGLPANGTGDIPSFTAINNGQALVTANITVTPANASCTGSPVTFKININPTTLTADPVSGSITACQGSASASPDLQQFSVSGNGLQNNVTVTAPANFQVSLSQGTGYSGTVTIVPVAGKLNSTVIYVRSSATAPANNISGTVTVASAGAPNQMVNVSGIINALPTVNQLPTLAFNNGSATTTIHFTGTATTYTWTNDNPAIGLPANGTGDIPSFTAVNNGQALVTANITVTPANASCTGTPVTFKINVDPTPTPIITVAGNLSSLNTVYGTPSAQGSFNVSGEKLVSEVVITPPSGFEISTDGTNFKETITTGGPGTLTTTVVYIRLAKTTYAGNYAGNIILTTNGTLKNLAMPNSIVIPASIKVTADNKTRIFHSENPQLTVTYTGFVNGENESDLVKKPDVTTTATITSAAGDYAIYFTSDAESRNYNFTYNPGVLTVTPTGVIVSNTFSPNGDGINDSWAIKHIEYYPNCTVDIFSRWGAKMFSSIGYGQQWDGQSSGIPVATGTYYYVINLKDKSPVKSGWVLVLR